MFKLVLNWYLERYYYMVLLMKKLLIFIIFLTIFITGNSFAKIFKSKNGYQFKTPKKHEIMERKYLDSYMTIIYDKKKHDDGKNIMFIMIHNDTEAIELLKTYKEVKLGDEYCDALHQTYKDQSPNKNVDLYQCTKKTNLDLSNVLKTIYDTEHVNYFQYQYTFSLNNKLIMVSGTCKKSNCGNRDRQLIELSNSINW